MKKKIYMHFNFGKFFQTGKLEDLEFDLTDITTEYCVDTEKDLFEKKHYTPTYKDRLFLAKHCNIPRVKVKNLTEKYKIKVTTKLENANAIFVSDDFIMKSSTSRFYYNIKGSIFKKMLKYLVKENKIDNQDYTSILHHDQRFNKDSEEEPYDVIINNATQQQLNALLNNAIHLEHDESYSYDYFFNNDSKHYVDSLINSTVPIYLEKEIMVHLNPSDAVIIEEDTFETLDEMFSSSDDDNIVLAMEIIANAEFKKSLAYILILFFKHRHQMDRSPTKKHINFKALCKLLPKCLYNNFDANDVAFYLKDYKLFNVENLNIVLKYLGINVLNTNFANEHNVFQIKVITLNSESLEELNSNYKWIVKKDYIPVEKEKEEIEIINFDN